MFSLTWVSTSGNCFLFQKLIISLGCFSEAQIWHLLNVGCSTGYIRWPKFEPRCFCQKLFLWWLTSSDGRCIGTRELSRNCNIEFLEAQSPPLLCFSLSKDLYFGELAKSVWTFPERCFCLRDNKNQLVIYFVQVLKKLGPTFLDDMKKFSSSMSFRPERLKRFTFRRNNSFFPIRKPTPSNALGPAHYSSACFQQKTILNVSIKFRTFPLGPLVEISCKNWDHFRTST